MLGVLYIALGHLLIGVDGSGVTVLNDGIGLLLLLSGTVRIRLGWRRWRESGWVMLVLGAFGIVAGLVVLVEFPKTGLWVVGLLLGVDLIVHGAAWLGYAYPRRPGLRSGGA